MHGHLRYAAVALAAVGMAFPAFAQFHDENLRQALPPGFKIGFQTQRGPMTMTEAVPDGENVEDWSRMITTQVFLGRKGQDPSAFLSGMTGQWQAACPGSSGSDMRNSHANGYLVSMVLLRCPLNPATGKPEAAFFRAIAGADSFYLIQYAYRAIPTPDQIKAAAQYLGTVNVCDTRTPDHPCMDMKGFAPVAPPTGR